MLPRRMSPQFSLQGLGIALILCLLLVELEDYRYDGEAAVAPAAAAARPRLPLRRRGGSPPPPPPLSATRSATSTPSLPPSPSAEPSLAPAERLALAHLLPECASATGGRFLEELRAYGAWHAGKMAFLRAARGDVAEARRLQAAAGDRDAPLSLAVYGQPGGGWGDRVVAMVSAFGFALRYRRVFLIAYADAYPWVASPFFDWRLDAAALPLLQRELAATPLLALYTCDDFESCLWSSERPELEPRFNASRAISMHAVSNRGIWHAGMRREHVAWFDALTGGLPSCLHQALIRPRAALLAQPAVRRTMAAFAAARARGARVVGLHFRAGDAQINTELAASPAATPAAAAAAAAAAWTPASADALIDSMMMDESADLRAHASAGAGEVVFFVTDSALLRSAVAARYGSSIITTQTVLAHVGNDGSDVLVEGVQHWLRSRAIALDDVVRDALIDWWLLAQVDGFAGSIISGFSRSALLAGDSGAWSFSAPPCYLGDCCQGDIWSAKKCFYWGSGA